MSEGAVPQRSLLAQFSNAQNVHFNANCITRGPFSALMT
jgi:hypothetical protein